MKLEFQQCTLNDLETLQKLSIHTFRVAFEAQNNPTDFKAYTDLAFSTEQLASEINDLHSVFYFLTLNGEKIGFIKLNTEEAQSENFGEDALEIQRIYVLSEFQSQGFGKVMLEKALEEALVKQKKIVWLGVWEKNPGAIRFYQKNGFEIFGKHDFYLGQDLQQDLLLRKFL